MQKNIIYKSETLFTTLVDHFMLKLLHIFRLIHTNVVDQLAGIQRYIFCLQRHGTDFVHVHALVAESSAGLFGNAFRPLGILLLICVSYSRQAS